MRALVCGICLALASPAAAGRASYYVISDQAPQTIAANGYVQHVREVDAGRYEVSVETVVAPIGSTGSYAEVRAAGAFAVPEGFQLPSAVRRQLRPDLSAWEAATAIMRWAVENLEVDEDDIKPQDAVSVLRRHRGRCSGVANATVALLMAAGYQARTVSGALITDEGVIPHRWFECRLPGAGWVPSDPTLGLWTVTTRHLIFADTLRTLPEVQVVVPSTDGLERLATPGGMLVRPNRGAGLECRLAAAGPGASATAVLRGSGGEVRRAKLDPVARFSDLLPGRWVLQVERDGRAIESRELLLREGDFYSFVVEPPPRGAESESGP
jgi:hypothetical protein